MSWRQILGIISSVLVAVSGFLVWVRFQTPIGAITVTGIEGNEGYLAIAIGMMGVVTSIRRSSFTILSGVLGLVLAIVELVDLANSMESREMMENKGIIASIGEGIYLLLISSLVLLVAGILIQRAK